ncbi:MAG: flagellar basal-body MS-ring/collar protein FliF [Thermodesulfobacteriota bacterium]|nr:flagellar basal-body MS-ring/collar protein FliF [Thermodesulfobacteriota bacterium]
MASPKEIFEQARDILKQLTLIQKIVAGVIVAVVLGVLLSLSFVGTETNFKVLYSGLTPEDAASVVARLKESRVPYELAENGSAVLVPAGQVYETRLTMAGEGLPRGGGVGFEIFDQTSLGTTDFVQRLNYQRALQGELARTISGFSQVKSARVHIATPKESVFIEDTKPPSASVSVALAGREKLSKSEIQSIVNLVSSAVPNLSAKNVTVVDTLGRLLYRQAEDDQALLSASQLEYQVKVEHNLQNKVESMLEQVVGVNKVQARVTAEIDFSEVDMTEENFDPEGQVIRSEQLMREKDGSEDLAAGIPGVKGQLATYSEAGEDGEALYNSRRENITRNFEISKKIRKTKETPGAITRLSVAVMVDGHYEKSEDKEGTLTRKYQARTVEELSYFTKLTKNAIGFDEEREDQVDVVSMPFYLSSLVEPESDKMEKWRTLAEHLVMPFVILLLSVAFLLFIVKPFFRLMSEQQASAQRAAVLAEKGLSEEEMEEEELKLQPLGMTDQERIYKLAQSDPDRAADLVRRWLREEG